MAETATRAVPTEPGRTTRPGRPKSGGNFELYSWFFMRISGLLVIFLVIGHVLMVHVINPVEAVDFDFVVRRWNNPFWRIYDFLLLWLALVHGLNGIKFAVDDYVHSRGWRVFSYGVLWAVGFIFLVIGTLVIILFQGMPAA